MKIEPITHKKIPELIASKLARSILDKRYNTGDRLPSERVLIKELGVSRSSLREALLILAASNLIDSQ
ncbi:MAG: GntR family transcriptional regulator, partial [Chloroflexota bacterium]